MHLPRRVVSAVAPTLFRAGILCFGLVGTSFAQIATQAIAPVLTTNFSSGSIWRAGLNRVQCIYDSSHFTGQGVTAPFTIQRLRWRLADGLVGTATTHPAVDIWLGNSATDALAPSNTFAANRTGSHTLVYSGPVNVTTAAGTTPNSFVIDLPLSTPFVYSPLAGADLLLEIVIQTAAPIGATMATSNSAVAHRANTVRSLGSTVATTGSVSAFCPVVAFDGITPDLVPLVINEFSHHNYNPANPTVDDQEYVELYNPSTTLPVNVSGWSLRTTPGAQSFALPNVTIAPLGFLLIDSPANLGSPVRLPNTNFLDNGIAGLELRDTFHRTVDGVGWGHYLGEGATPAETSSMFPPFVSERVTASPDFAVAWSRILDGYDSVTTDAPGYNALDFHLQPQSRGLTNSFLPGSYPYSETAETYALGQPIPEWGGSKLLPVAATPPSPSQNGGKALLFATPPGASTGAAFMLKRRAERRISFDAYVYLDFAPAGQQHAWSIGARGTTDPEYQWPDPTGAGGDNGDVGLCWTYVAGDASGKLYLLDRNDGGRDIVYAADPILINTPGWVRLRLESNAGRGMAYYGGTVGQFDGSPFPHAITDTRGNLWVGVRSSYPGYGLLMDGVLVGVDEIITEGRGAGCAGNCPRLNPSASLVETKDTLSELGVPVKPPGTWRVVMTPNTGTGNTNNTTVDTTGIRFFSEMTPAVADAGGPVTATAAIRNQFGTLIVGPGVLSADPDRKGWWLMTWTSTTLPSTFLVDFTPNGTLYLPIAETVLDGFLQEGSPVLVPVDLVSPAQTIVAGWSVELICPTTTGESRDEVDAEVGPGSTAKMRLRGGSSNSLTVKLLSLAPGPFDLTPFGAPGCTAHVAPGATSTTFLLTDLRGSASYNLAIPNSPALSGVQIYSQWASLDAVTNVLGIVVSNGVRITIR